LFERYFKLHLNNLRMETLNTSHKWFRIALLNLSIVALLGVLMRYKIAFSLPFVDQKHVLHAHSHFAFTGWITQALMTLLVGYFSRVSGVNAFCKYKWLLVANLVAAYGMLGSFPVQGYGVVSIAFATMSIFVSYVFAGLFWRDLNKLENSASNKWFKAALLFSTISSAGTFALSYMNATKVSHPNWYLAAIYFYLHFQYNGWFFFACMGLIFYLFKKTGVQLPFRSEKIAFGIFAFACIPAYILSALWLPIPEWVHTIVTIAALLQIAGWAMVVTPLLKNKKENWILLGKGRWVLALSAMAFTVKLLLQFGSTFHFLSTLAFGFRPIVIGYLHLVLLGVVTLSIIGYCMSTGIISSTNNAFKALALFVAGIILNELLLMIQGVAAIGNTGVPYINQLLLAVAAIMFTALVWLNMEEWRNKPLAP
jgi:hypothetical protein